MKWLQWSTIDLEKGSGGVEAHARSLARELSRHGIETKFSQNPKDLFLDTWDVIHTHGSSIPAALEFRAKKRKSKTLWIHTLHGLSHERMIACREFLWLGGYKAIGRELASVIHADVVFSVHNNLSVYPLLQKIKKFNVVCSNGWDSWGDDKQSELSLSTLDKLIGADPFWVFIGRGGDPVKNVRLVKEAWSSMGDLNLVCVPGAGFEDVNWAMRIGALAPNEIRLLLKRARGLVITSHYEGLPLVVLEALSLGLPVVATNVGGLKTLSRQINGLYLVDAATPSKIRGAVETAMLFPADASAIEKRIENNRKFLKTWKDVADIVLKTVETAMKDKRR